jgi:hypothetical protein
LDVAVLDMDPSLPMPKRWGQQFAEEVQEKEKVSGLQV